MACVADGQVATRPALYALERLRVGGGSLVVPSVQLLPRADIPASFCAALATRLASPCVAVSLNGKLCAASGSWCVSTFVQCATNAARFDGCYARCTP